MAEIQLKQVAKKFGESWAVKPMDLTIGSGEFVALLGPSGCGKTTTLRMISGLEAVTEGRIYIDGKDVTWLTASPARHRLRLPVLRPVPADDGCAEHRVPARIAGHDRAIRSRSASTKS